MRFYRAGRERDRAVKSGADVYFVKPFDLDLLKVNQLTGEKK